MKNLRRALLLIVLLVLPVYNQQREPTLEEYSSEKRIALIIGNGAYDVSPLKNPVNDAHDVAQALRTLDFDVALIENANQDEMKRAIRAFGDKIRGGGVGLFYFAGHGIQVSGRNYLIPVGASFETEGDFENKSVNAGYVLEQMASARNRMNIMILDACRNNPFAQRVRSGSRGLSLNSEQVAGSADSGLASMQALSGTLIAYATAPGSVALDGTGRNGFYTAELLQFMKTPGLTIEEMFKRVRVSLRDKTQGRQIAWESSSLTGSFYFKVPSNNEEFAKERAAIEKENPRIEARNREIMALNAKRQRLLDAGNEAFRAKNYEAAISIYDEGIRADPLYSSVFHLNRSIALRMRGVERYNASLKTRDRAGKESGLADLRASAESADKALTLYRGLTPTNADKSGEVSYLQSRAEGYRLLVITSSEAGLYQAAIRAIQDYLPFEPNVRTKVNLHQALARAYANAGNMGEAKAQCRLIRTLAPGEANEFCDALDQVN